MRTKPTDRVSVRMLVLVEVVLVATLVLSWVVAYLAAQGALDQLPVGSRNYLLALYATEGRLWPALALAFVGIGLLVARHWWPTMSFVGVSGVVVFIDFSYPYLTRLQLASTIMLVVATFWTLWLTDRFRLLAVLAVLVAAASTAAGYQVNRNLSTASTLDLTSERFVDIGSGVTTLQSMLLVAVAIGAAALVRRFDDQAAELAERNRELAERNRELDEQRAASARAAVLDERVTIARELHDVVAHHVTTMTVHAGAARQVVAAKPAAATESLQQIEQAGRDAVFELQRLLGFLRGDDHDGRVDSDGRGGAGQGHNGRGPTPSLRHLNQLGGSLDGGLECRWDLSGDFEAVPQSVDVSAYRIVQEALTNVMKHSTADRATVTVHAAPDQVSVCVADPGPSRESSATKPAGHGVVGMRERASLHGGSVSVGPDGDGGWSVEAMLPYAGR